MQPVRDGGTLVSTETHQTQKASAAGEFRDVCSNYCDRLGARFLWSKSV